MDDGNTHRPFTNGMHHRAIASFDTAARALRRDRNDYVNIWRQEPFPFRFARPCYHVRLPPVRSPLSTDIEADHDHVVQEDRRMIMIALVISDKF